MSQEGQHEKGHHQKMVEDFRRRFWISLVITLPILVRSNPLDAVAIFALSEATYRKMIQNLIWATGYNVIAIPLAAGALYGVGILLSPAMGALLMSLSTVIVAVNARFLSVD